MELSDDPDIRGAKLWGCDIVINRSLLGQDERWRTLIHELLHSYSVGYSSTDYWASRGWEEGVVEQLQRLLRPEVLRRLHLNIPTTVFEAVQEHPLYNEYVAALEALRVAVGQEPVAFCLAFLAMPIRDRSTAAYGMGRHLDPPEYRSFVRVLSASNATLKKER